MSRQRPAGYELVWDTRLSARAKTRTLCSEGAKPSRDLECWRGEI
jgi:hypothetical protein